MFAHFQPRHIPALYVGFAMTFGGLWPFFNASSSLSAFGFPPHISGSSTAWPVVEAYGTRTSLIGILVYTFYFQQKYVEVDTVVALVGFYAGILDAYVVAKQGKPRYALFRMIASFAIGTWGFYGLTEGR